MSLRERLGLEPAPDNGTSLTQRIKRVSEQRHADAGTRSPEQRQNIAAQDDEVARTSAARGIRPDRITSHIQAIEETRERVVVDRQLARQNGMGIPPAAEVDFTQLPRPAERRTPRPLRIAMTSHPREE